MNELYKYVKTGTKTVASANWTGRINLSDSKVKEFIEFLYYAKTVEKSSVLIYDPWNYENSETLQVSAQTVAQLTGKYNQTSDPFLKNRYWFQTVKALFYSESKNLLPDFYEKTEIAQPINMLYYRAMSYYAGALRLDNQNAKSNYVYAQVYQSEPMLNTVASFSFNPASESEWSQILSFAKSTDEEIAIWALLGFKYDEFRAIAEIYKLNPQSEHLNYLITRLINKIEDRTFNQYSNSTDAFKKTSAQYVSPEALSLLSTAAKSGKLANPFLANIAAGYLHSLSGNYAEAAQFYAVAEKTPNQTIQYSNQLRLLKLLNNVLKIESMNVQTENELLPELNWLYFNCNNETTDLRINTAQVWIKRFLAMYYQKSNNVLLAEAFNPSENFYSDAEKTKSMESFMLKPQKSAFQDFALKLYPVKINDINMYLALYYTYNNNLTDAWNYIQKADGYKDEILSGNPFNARIVDCHDCDHLAVQKTKFSKMRFVEIIKIMLEKVARNEDLYNNYLLLGNAYYNITYYGNARYFYSNYIIENGGNFNSSNSLTSDSEYSKFKYDCSTAQAYYQKAYNAATTDEQRAKCTFLIAKCELNTYYNTEKMLDYSNEEKPLYKSFESYKALKNNFKHTKYYTEVIKECGYFASWAKN